MEIDLTSYFPKVEKLAAALYKKIKVHPQNKCTLEELIKEGIKGLIKANSNKKFDPNIADFWRFANRYVYFSMISWIDKQSKGNYSQIKKLKAAEEMLTRQLEERSPTNEELAAELSVKVKKIHEIRSWQLSEKNISELPLTDENSYDPENVASGSELSDHIMECTESKLTPKQKFIIKSIYGESITVKRLSIIFGVTPQTVYYHNKNGLKRLKECLEEKGWTLDTALKSDWLIEKFC